VGFYPSHQITNVNKVHILSFAGSLRKGSYNKLLLTTAAKALPEGVSMDIFDLEGIPLYNQDLESAPNDRVLALKNSIRSADAILIATPEYIYSVPGVLKNAIDWASRPPKDNPFQGKPVAIVGATPGMLGTSRAQYHLRQTFVFLDMRPLNKPEVMVAFARDKFDENGTLTDETTKALLSQLLHNLAAEARRTPT
jgi:chromate reductase